MVITIPTSDKFALIYLILFTCLISNSNDCRNSLSAVKSIPITCPHSKQCFVRLVAVKSFAPTGKVVYDIFANFKIVGVRSTYARMDFEVGY